MPPQRSTSISPVVAGWSWTPMAARSMMQPCARPHRRPSGRGCAAPDRRAMFWWWANCCMRPGWKRRWIAADWADTRSFAANPVPGRPMPWARFWNKRCSAPVCASSSSIRTRTTSASVGPAPGSRPTSRPNTGRSQGRYACGGDDDVADRSLRLTFADLTPPIQAAALGLDPLEDREEYAVLTTLLRRRKAGRPLVEPDDLLHTKDVAARRLGMRAANLGILDWRIWDPGSPSLIDEVREPTARCTVVDLGSLRTVGEQRLVSAAVLSTLWSLRMHREPVLVVIDEAHNVGPAQPSDELSELSAASLAQIAAEGRKFGLYLLLATQRPHKLEENVLSQCDNLMLMRMNSEADLQDIGRVLSYAPSGLLAGATSFALGHALVAGRLLPFPAYIKMGTRISEEGGADVPASWAMTPATAG